jgi:flagellar protein FliS
MLGNAYASYRKQSITTLTPIEIVVKLYDECEKQMNRAVHFIENKDLENANNALMKSVDIVGALRSVLDMKIPMSKDLDALYEYFTHELISANLKKDTEVIKTLLPMLADLKEAFSEIAKIPRDQMIQMAKSAVAVGQL